MIEVHTVPATDATFREQVREAIAAVDRIELPPGEVAATSEDSLRLAPRAIRARYPEVGIRRREEIASHTGRAAWYVFREAP